MLFVNVTICQIGQWAVHFDVSCMEYVFSTQKNSFKLPAKDVLQYVCHTGSTESKKQFCIVSYIFWECKCNDNENIKFFEKNDVPYGQWIFWWCIIVLFREKTS